MCDCGNFLALLKDLNKFYSLMTVLYTVIIDFNIIKYQYLKLRTFSAKY